MLDGMLFQPVLMVNLLGCILQNKIVLIPHRSLTHNPAYPQMQGGGDHYSRMEQKLLHLPSIMLLTERISSTKPHGRCDCVSLSEQVVWYCWHCHCNYCCCCYSWLSFDKIFIVGILHMKSLPNSTILLISCCQGSIPHNMMRRNLIWFPYQKIIISTDQWQ